MLTDEMVDIFTVAGMDMLEISILSDEFLTEASNPPQRNFALIALQKLINDEIKTIRLERRRGPVFRRHA